MIQTFHALKWLVWRELQGISVHRWLIAGLAAAFLGGIAIVSVVSSQLAVWAAFQCLYYLLPLCVILSTTMIVRQDLGEGPFLAMFRNSNRTRVAGKFAVATLYNVAGVLLFLLPFAVAGGNGFSVIALFGGAVLLTAICVSIAVAIGFRARHEVRAYLCGIACWIVLLLGSSLLAYVATLSFSPAHSPAITLGALMMNPVESFRIHVFFGLSTIPMNPHTSNAVAVWWLGHPLQWLAVVSTAYALPLLGIAARKLRHRAHAFEA